MSKKTTTDAKNFLRPIAKIWRSKSNRNSKRLTKTEDNQRVNGTYIPLIEGFEYKMDHARSGKAFIFNNINFSVKLGRRDGSRRDAGMLSTILKDEYGFEVEIWEDLKYAEIYDTLRDAANDDYSDCNCIMVVVMTHGGDNILYAKDRWYRPEELWVLFTDTITLVGKPKIFFVQACRGKKLDDGAWVQYSDSNVTYTTIPIMADILVMYSTVAGYASMRNTNEGTWFIQQLCKELSNDKLYGKDLLQILTWVNREVALNKMTDQPNMKGKKQMGCIVSTLTRILYLPRKNNTQIN